jgi:choline-sulfatase
MKTDQLNILLIISDQMIAALTGVYGHPVVQTPHLERLAAEGVRFDAAYAAFPLCAPARACMMTGRHASEIGAWDNAALLAADQVTFAHYLSRAGYDTVLSGKMHFVGPDQLHGFQRRLTTDIYPSSFDWVKPEWIRIKEARGHDFEHIMNDRASYHARGYTGEGVRVGVWHNALSYDEETHFRAVEYLRSVARRPEDGPFMLCASYHHPHEPFWPPQDLWELYEGAEIAIPRFPASLDDTYSLLDRNLNAYHGTRRYNLRDADGLRRLRRAYYALVTYMDRKVGELLDVLEGTGLADSTIVIFTSDHGDMLCEKEMVQKRCLYEWSCRVPLLVRFPDGWKAGTTCPTPVSHLDLLPTLCELAGEEAVLPTLCDGSSLLGLLENGPANRCVFAQAHEAVGMPGIMARQGPYKYVHIHGDKDQLFDLEADPGEWRNLVDEAAHAGIAAALRGQILQRFDPDEMARENLESLYRRQYLRDVMRTNGTHWDYAPRFDPREGALDQYLAPST